MNFNIKDPIILTASYVLNIGVWAGNFGMFLKVILAILAGLTTIMAFMNTFKTWQRNYRTLWLVVTINHVFTFIRKSPKSRQRGIRITQTKNKEPK